MENQLVVLPSEVAEIAKNVSVEKRNEVQNVLNNIFNGVAKMREQLENVTVTDANDKVNMKLANTIRLGVRQVRLEAEKTFDAKRADVQQQMLSYKTEDSLWLKAKQTMQILTKEIEENARWKEETKARFEAEQKELKVQQRMLKVAKVAPEMARSEFENMSDETFEMFFSGIEKAYNDKIEAEKKAEAERIEKENAEIAERERIRKENEQLKAKAEAKEKQLIAERAKAEAARIAAKKAAAEKDKLEAELKAELKAEADRKENERKAKEAAEKKAKNAPDKEKLLEIARNIDNIAIPEIKSEEAQKILSDVKILLSKVSVFIREKSSGL